MVLVMGITTEPGTTGVDVETSGSFIVLDQGIGVYI